jgi:hypothetical protein
MVGFDRGKRRIFLLLAAVGSVVLLLNLSLLSGTDLKSKIEKVPIHLPGKDKKPNSGLNTPPDPDASGLAALKHCPVNVEISFLKVHHGNMITRISKIMRISMMSTRLLAS